MSLTVPGEIALITSFREDTTLLRFSSIDLPFVLRALATASQSLTTPELIEWFYAQHDEDSATMARTARQALRDFMVPVQDECDEVYAHLFASCGLLAYLQALTEQITMETRPTQMVLSPL